jgi:signal transduction histidine kinase
MTDTNGHSVPQVGDALVLNVNDHEGVRYMISRMLDRGGLRVEEAGTIAEATEKVRRLKPKLVVLDIKLPDGSGLDLCRSLKQTPQTQAVKVLHTSAIFVAPEAKVQSLNSGADGYLSYPFEQEELLATARSLLRLYDAEQRLRDTADELQNANQRTHEFLAMLAHELRNPLSAITTCLPVLEREAPRDDLESSAWQVMRRQTVHLRRLVDDLLDTARVTQGKIVPKWETVDLVALLSRVADSTRRSLTDGRKQQLQFRYSRSRVPVRGDSLRLEQVFFNLLDNASKYTPEGGRIDVDLRLANDASNQVHVIVRDTGIGIPPQALGSIFNLFSQADVPLARSRGGLGIGLTLVRTLVELHGGAVSARSDGIGKGCEMQVDLPVLVDSTLEPPESLRDEAPSREKAPKRRILVVEDNPDAQSMLKILLEMWGHEVTVASDGRAGIEAIQSQHPDIALVDIGLPLADGYELARTVRKSNGNRKNWLLVALTGYGAPEQRARALEAGFDVHLVKPVEPAQLASLISRGTAIPVEEH